jgi:two-component system, NarL family, nitrate/nitrite response regulator NarL
MNPQQMLKQLVKQFAGYEPSQVLQRTREIVDEVIWESEVEGTCYCLVRRRLQGERKVNLSPREQAIAELVARGFPNKVIARELEISPWTVATHLNRMFHKLGVTTRAAMVAQLLETNLLPARDRDLDIG